MQLFIKLPLLIIGRSVQGLGIGGFTNLIPSMIYEVSPPIVRGRTGTMVQFTINIGLFISAAMGIIALPYHAREIQKDENNFYWRATIGFPIVIGFIMLLLFLLCYNHDTPLKSI